MKENLTTSEKLYEENQWQERSAKIALTGHNVQAPTDRFSTTHNATAMQ